MSLAVYLLLVPSMSISKNTRGLIFILDSVLKREKGKKKKKKKGQGGLLHDLMMAVYVMRLPW